MQGGYSNRRDNALCKYYFTVGLYFLREVHRRQKTDGHAEDDRACRAVNTR